MNEMYIFYSFRISINYLHRCFVFFVIEISVFTCSTESLKERFEIYHGLTTKCQSVKEQLY